VSGPAPKNYVIHAVGIAIVIIIAMIFFLKSQWGH
jgi:hypothetical protein